MNSLSDLHICVVGLGYVGLPLAVALSKQFTTMGFDIDANRVLQISNGIDVTQEVDKNELLNSSRLSVTANVDEIISASVYIITVPTPIYKNKKPNLTPLKKASETIGRVLKKGDLL